MIEEREKFLEDLGIVNIPLPNIKHLTNEVLNIGRFLRARKNPLPELVDSYLIALTKSFNGNLVFLTMNHKHFGHSLKRFYTFTIVLSEEEVLTLGFYKKP